MKALEGLKPRQIALMWALGFLFFLLFIVLPLIFFFAPSILKSLFAVSLLEKLTITVISYTGWDVWLARATAFALIWLPPLFILRFIGAFILPGKVFIRKGRRLIFIVGGVSVFLAMHFISRNINFSPITGEPLKKYYRHNNCSIEFFPVEMEYHPYLGEPLQLLTRDIVKDAEKQKLGLIVLSVISTPPGAEAYLDWSKVGITPLKLETRNSRVRLVVVKDGYEPEFRDSVDCSNNETLRFVLQPHSQLKNGFVVLEIREGDVNGQVYSSFVLELRRRQIPVLDQASNDQFRAMGSESGGLQNKAFRAWLMWRLHASFVLNVSARQSVRDLGKENIGNEKLQTELKGLFSIQVTMHADLVDVQTGTTINETSSTADGFFLDKEQGILKCLSKASNECVNSTLIMFPR